jgi:hypothetical protein
VNGFTTTIFRPMPDVRATVEAQSGDVEAGIGRGRESPRSGGPDKYPTSTRQVLEALAHAGGALGRADLQSAAALRDREHFVNEHLRPLLAGGLIEPTIPDRPRSSKQRYRLTYAGRALLAKGLLD